MYAKAVNIVDQYNNNYSFQSMTCLGNIDQSPCQGLSSKEKDLHLIGQLLYIVLIMLIT